MKKNNYKILRKNIPTIKLVSTSSQNWFNYSGSLVPWSGSVYIGPNINDIIYNPISGSVSEGYYKWSGIVWNSISSSSVYDNYNLPILLTGTVDEMGVMSGFDGDLEQIDQICNFSYTQTGNTVNIYNTVNPNKLKTLVEEEYTIIWGDGTTNSTIGVVTGSNLPTVSHTYSSSSDYTITIQLDSPWSKTKISKNIIVPADITISNPVGSFTSSIVPAYNNLTGQTQDYLNDLDYTDNPGSGSIISFMSIGASRIDEKKLYGTNSYSGVTSGSLEDGTLYWDYVIDDLHYRDLSDGMTYISGTTSGYTKEEVFNQRITRNEHFLGFIDEPTVYSDIFVDRPKESVMEKNIRLGEIDNIGELDIYGFGYFYVRKQ